MLYCYRSRDWDGALEAIELCQSAEHNFGLTGLFDLYRTRIQAFREIAPPCGLDGDFCRGDEIEISFEFVARPYFTLSYSAARPPKRALPGD